MRELKAALLLCIGLAGCASHRPVAQCTWPLEARSVLDLRARAARRHLHEDALRAEDIGIRYADARNAPHSGHFEGFAAYSRTTDSCVTAMFEAVARTHAVAADTVRASLADRPLWGDAGVTLSLAVLFGFIAYGVAGRVNRNFPFDGGRASLVAIVAVVMTSILASGLAVLIGEWSAISIEVFRVGNGHLSQRTGRVPWTHHRTELFLAGLVVFWLMAALRHRVVGGESDHATLASRRTPPETDNAARTSQRRRPPLPR